MKKIYLILSVIAIFIIVVVACSKETDNDASLTDNSQQTARILSDDDLARKIGTGVKVECSGDCDCYFDLNVNSMTDSCSCTPCHLDLHFIEERTMTAEDKDDIYESILNHEFFVTASRDMPAYINSQYGTTLKGYDGIEFYIKNNITVIIFKFRGTDGQTGSVLYSNRVAGPKFRVDCHGSCDCTEQFNFNTNVASCSCTPCVMDVTTLSP